jgi:hypothetical protein
LWSAPAAQGINVLCPSGRTDSDDDWVKRSSRPGKFTKREFHYDPPGMFIVARRVANSALPTRSRMRSAPLTASIGAGASATAVHCVVNALIHRAVASSRYVGEKFREWMAALLEHPLARARHRRRKAIVEPYFAELRKRQGLKRFHRRGLAAVRVEFALHCMAFKLETGGEPLLPHHVHTT